MAESLKQAGFPETETSDSTKKLYSFDDTGNSDRLFDEYGEIIRYCYISKSWFHYDGRKWNRDIEGAVKRMADETINSMRKDFDYYMRNAPSGVDISDYEKQFIKH
jgi:putative DNA primase/helicase